MRKVTFYIDDAECFRAEFISSGLTEEQTDKLVSDMKGFKAVYTLYGDGCFPDRYTLTDPEGNKISINDLNGFEKGVILNECMAYFTGKNNFTNGKTDFYFVGDMPTGVINIEEKET